MVTMVNMLVNSMVVKSHKSKMMYYYPNQVLRKLDCLIQCLAIRIPTHLYNLSILVFSSLMNKEMCISLQHVVN